VDFTGLSQLIVGYNNCSGALVELHVDSPDGPAIGTLVLPAKEGSGQSAEMTFDMTAGFHDLYLVVKDAEGKATTDVVLQLDWIEFVQPQ
ncbi:MAG: carbohydrate-binding protein, partial [Bacteroidia bacterium]|nr:carbohydrate-binding protein [Bacteroidia bacterium]